MDTFYGRRLYTDMCGLGLIDVEAEGRVRMGRGATPDAEFWRLSYTQARDRTLGTSLLSPVEFDKLVELFDDPDFVWMGAVVMAVSGRSPEVPWTVPVLLPQYFCWTSMTSCETEACSPPVGSHTTQ